MKHVVPARFIFCRGPFGFAVLLFLLIAQPVRSEIIPSDRRIDWNPGVPGGIPQRTTIYVTLQPGATAAQINSALASCPSNQVVFLAAGTYNISGVITVPSYTTLRGAGPGQTVLNLNSGSTGIQFGSGSSPNPNTSTAITGGLTKGSTNITVSSASGIAPGTLLMINQLDDPSFVTDVGSEGTANWDDGGWPGDRDMGQIVRVTSVAGSNLGIDPPLYYPYNNSPLANRYTAGCILGGVEDLKVYAMNVGYTANFLFNGAEACWLKNIESDFADGDHAQIEWSLNCEIRDSYFHDGFSHTSGGTDNCLRLMHKSSACLIENNILYRMHVSVMLEWGAAGNVISYNYSTGNYHQDYLAWMINDFDFHGAHPAFNLFEGNIGDQFRPDSTWGSSSHSTLLRNWFRGARQYVPPLNSRGPLQTNNATWENANNYAYTIDYLSQSNNFVGNAAGSAWLAANGGTYLKTSSPNGRSEYRFGFNSDNDTYVNNNAWSSTLFQGNYSYNNNSQQWDSTLADHNIPVSYYLSTKPAWFGNLNWPPIDPANGKTLSITNIPAGYRFVLGISPPAGPANLPPVVAAVASPTNGIAPLPVIFSSAGSSDPEGGALSFAWTFGDGASSTAANPTHTYATNGVYVVQLAVTDNANQTTTTSLTVNVGNQPPFASASGSPTTGGVPLTVAFSSAGSSDPEGAALSYAWSFGDGSTSTNANVSHTYQAIGTYLAQLTVFDGVKSSVATVTINVSNPTSGLVAAYGFDDGSGLVTADASGNGNLGTVNGATWSASGHFGKALSFGPGALVSVNDSASLDLTTNLTLEAWVYPTSSTNSWMNLIIKPDGDPASTNPSFVLQGGASSSTVPSAFISPAASNVLSTIALPLATWSHVAATYDGSALKLYVNATLAGSQAVTGAMTTSTNALTIGGNVFYGSNWNGLIDEVRIYNRALSQSEIMADMVTPVSQAGMNLPPPTNLRVLSP